MLKLTRSSIISCAVVSCVVLFSQRCASAVTSQGSTTSNSTSPNRSAIQPAALSIPTVITLKVPSSKLAADVGKEQDGTTDVGDGDSVPFGCTPPFLEAHVVYDHASPKKLTVDYLGLGSRPKVKRGQCVRWRTEVRGGSGDLIFGTILFMNLPSDLFLLQDNTKSVHECNKDPKNPKTIINHWQCQWTKKCVMPIYLDMPDCIYHYGVVAYFQPQGSDELLRKESDPDLEVSGPPPFDPICVLIPSRCQ